MAHTDEELDELETALAQLLTSFARRHSLTRAENVDLLSRVYSAKMIVTARYMIREERKHSE